MCPDFIWFGSSLASQFKVVEDVVRVASELIPGATANYVPKPFKANKFLMGLLGAASVIDAQSGKSRNAQNSAAQLDQMRTKNAARNEEVWQELTDLRAQHN